MNTPLRKMFVGAAAGTLATVPMSFVMLIGKRLLPWMKRDPLPPARITSEATKAIGLHDDIPHEGRMALTAVSHFGYGATMGAVYGFLPSPQSPAAAAASGAAFGLAVWSGSYLGWLPAAGLYRSATEEPAERNALVIGAHLVWGASLGLIAHGLSRSALRRQGSARKRGKAARRSGRRVRHRLRQSS